MPKITVDPAQTLLPAASPSARRATDDFAERLAAAEKPASTPASDKQQTKRPAAARGGADPGAAATNAPSHQPRQDEEDAGEERSEDAATGALEAPAAAQLSGDEVVISAEGEASQIVKPAPHASELDATSEEGTGQGARGNAARDSAPSGADAAGAMKLSSGSSQHPVTIPPANGEQQGVATTNVQPSEAAPHEAHQPIEIAKQPATEARPTQSNTPRELESAGESPEGEDSGIVPPTAARHMALTEATRSHAEGDGDAHPPKQAPHHPGADAGDAIDTAVAEAQDQGVNLIEEGIAPREETAEAPSQGHGKTEDPAAPSPNGGSLERIASGRFGGQRAPDAATAPRDAPVDPQRFVSRVGRAIEAATHRGGDIRLRLSPPELGAMQIKLSISSEGAMHAAIETETTAARNVLLDNLPALRDRLAQMDIRIEKFDVGLQQNGSGRQDWTPNEQQRDGHQRPQPGQRGPKPSGTPVPSITTQSQHTVATGPDQINLVA